jgi:hypothetical protein
VLCALLTAGSLAPAAPDDEVVYPLVFPLLGDHVLTDSFGDPRGSGRAHAGVDIMAERMTPVVAGADGEVAWVFAERGGRCCHLALRHEDGWSSRYVHLNNDTPGTDDGRAVGIAPGIAEGAPVVAGQVLGWVGDSGNAEETASHLHFELRRPDGEPVDPVPSLLAAERRGRVLVAPPPGGGRREQEGREGLWRWLRRGGREEEGEEAPPAPAPPAPAVPETLRTAPPAAAPPPAAAGEEPLDGSAGLAMDRRVELVGVDDDCCGELVGPDEERAERGEGGWLSCVGFGRSRREGSAAAPEGG